ETYKSGEDDLPCIKGRKYNATRLIGEYRAYVAVEGEDAPPAMGLETLVIPGGANERRKLEGWSDRMPEIGETFRAMAAEFPPDPARPNIEFYRSQKELLLFMAVVSR